MNPLVDDAGGRVVIEEGRAADARRCRDLARVANVYSLKLAHSCHAIDKAGAEVAFDVAIAYLRRAAELDPGVRA